SAYEFLRNKVLDANDFFLNKAGLARPPWVQNQFGANVGGPVLKDKLFFFSGYEGFRQRKGSTLTTWVPTAAERAGDFSQPGSTHTTSVLPIYDPLTSVTTGPGACNANPPPASCRTQFAFNGVPNVIDPARIDPTSQALLTYFQCLTKRTTLPATSSRASAPAATSINTTSAST